jgi:hypothetical protein
MYSQFESWFRREVRAGRATGIKYVNVLGRQWNLQTWSNYYAMKAGTLRPLASNDVGHIHISFENGSIDSDLVARYVNFHYGRSVSTEGDDVTPAELMAYKLSSGSWTGTKAVGDLLKAGYITGQEVKALHTEVDDIKALLTRVVSKLGA